MTNKTNAQEQALETACMLVAEAKLECARGDVSHFVLRATTVIREGAPDLDATAATIDADAPWFVVNGFLAEAANEIVKATSLAIELGDSEVSRALYRALEAIGNAQEARRICVGEYIPTNLTVEQIDERIVTALQEKDLWTAQEFAKNDPFTQLQGPNTMVPALILDEEDTDSEESPIEVASDEITPFSLEYGAEEVGEESILECSEEIEEVRTVVPGRSDSITFFNLAVPALPPPPSFSARQQSVPPLLPWQRQQQNPNQLLLPFNADSSEELPNHTVYMTFSRPLESDHADLRAIYPSAAN